MVSSTAGWLQGVIPSMNTPFDASGQFDADSFQRELDVIQHAGCPGALMLAAAGEGLHLSLEEFSQVLETAANKEDFKLPVMVSISANDQSERLARAERAFDAGATAVLVSIPEVSTQEQRVDLLGAVAEKSPAMVTLQDFDPRGEGLAVDDLVDLVNNLPSVKMLKIETLPAGPKFSALREKLGDSIRLSGGWTVLQLMDAMDREIDAFIPTEMEEAYVAIWNLHRSGAIEEARMLWEQLLPIIAFSNQSLGVSIRMFKEFRVSRGTFSTNISRIPEPTLDSIQQAEVDRLWSRYTAIRESL
jgi:dihydrodipicolinate synthase/N-acetylneuraminate lyase